MARRYRGPQTRLGGKEAVGEIKGEDPHLISALRKEGGGRFRDHFNVHSQWTEII